MPLFLSKDIPCNIAEISIPSGIRFRGDSESGFTLIELIVVVLLMAVLGTMTAVYVGNNLDANRYEETVQKLKSIRNAIIGDDSVDAEGHRTHFGYVGDMGNMPAALVDLTTIGTQVAWEFNSCNPDCNCACNMGAGWRGPYFKDQLTSSIAVNKDAWNNAFVYNTSGTATITSYGSDGAAGGTGYAKDITLQIPQNQMFATVKGVFKNGDMVCSNQSVGYYTVAAGAITQSVVTSSATGLFTFPSVPYGLRTFTGTGVSCILNASSSGPVKYVVDRPEVTVPVAHSDAMGYGGSNFSSCTTGNSGAATKDQVWITYDVNYSTTMTPTYMTVSWTQVGFLSQVIFDPVGATNGPDTQTFSPPLSSGTRVKLTSSPSLTAEWIGEQIELFFVTYADGNGYANMAGSKVTVVLEYAETARKDTLVCSL